MSKHKRILVVDDEKFCHEFLEYTLKRASYKTIKAYTGEEVIEKAKNDNPDLIILDLGLPGLRGEDVLLKIREDSNSHKIPVLILSYRGEPEDIVRLLKLGADDYLTKPFAPKVMLAKIQSLLRRQCLSNSKDIISVDSLVIDKNRHEVLIEGKLIETTKKEFLIICLLFENQGAVIKRNRIHATIDGVNTRVTNRSIDVHIASIRKKLRSYSDNIRTVRGVGYKFAKR